jgi:hypothetical protein
MDECLSYPVVQLFQILYRESSTESGRGFFFRLRRRSWGIVVKLKYLPSSVLTPFKVRHRRSKIPPLFSFRTCVIISKEFRRTFGRGSLKDSCITAKALPRLEVVLAQVLLYEVLKLPLN